MAIDVAGFGSIADLVGKALDKIWPDPAERDAAKLALFKAQQDGAFKEMDETFELAKAQIGVDAIEAGSESLYKSGWRPSIGWTCSFALAYAAIIDPLARFTATVIFHYVGAFPVIDTTITMQVLFGLLGLGAYRTVEKLRGVQ